MNPPSTGPGIGLIPILLLGKNVLRGHMGSKVSRSITWIRYGSFLGFPPGAVQCLESVAVDASPGKSHTAPPDRPPAGGSTQNGGTREGSTPSALPAGPASAPATSNTGRTNL